MSYFCAALWFVIGVVLIVSFGKENKIFYATGAFFLFLGGWWLANALTAVDLFASPWVWGLRGVCLVMLAILAVFYVRYYRKPAKPGEEEDEKSE